MPLDDVLRQRTHALASSLNNHRILLYTLVSLFAVSAVVANALKNYSNFYSVAISLSKSNRSVLALANFVFLLALLCGHVVQRIFFGTLRANEVERLYDRLWFFITESLLAFTIFRDEFDIPFALMFGFLLFVKSFHWLAGDRIEWMDQRPYPGPSRLFHLRMTSLLVILWVTDCLMFLVAVENTITNGVGGMVLFASEYGILIASVLNAMCKYALSTYELRRARLRGGENAPPWENKSMWVFYIELATDFLKLTTYLVFFMIIITFYGLPLNIVRDVYITARSFITRLRALHRYQTATRNMDQRYPNATAEELRAISDRTCIICREEMALHEQGQPPNSSDGPNMTPKKLPCGHIFHFHCLRSWLERQQSCPTCRRTVLDAHPQDQAAGPPAPAAPADPQRANAVPPGAQNQPGVNNPLGNPLGLMGRLFGPPAQPPIVPGPLPQNQNNATQNNVAGQLPQGVVIQYHIQYQQPRNQPQQQNENPLQPLQPAPPFPGFAGPGGIWQPWPEGRQDGETPQVLAPGTNDPVPVPSISNTTSNSQPSPPSSPGPDTAVSHGQSNAPATPREAAALAALRRINSNVGGSAGLSNADGFERQTTVATPTSASATEVNGNVPSTSNNAASSNTPGVPSLIPLEFGSFVSGSSALPLNGAPQSSSSRPVRGPHTHGSIGPTENSWHFPRGAPPPSQTSAQQAQTERSSTSLLPPTLTDHQLAVMDRLTREAIDERLRVLEGVSGAVYRCIDDLMRMRSALPSPTPIIPSQTAPPISPTNPELSSSLVDDVNPPDTLLKDSQIPEASDPGPSGLTSGEHGSTSVIDDENKFSTAIPDASSTTASP